jgi:sarcosine oxidase delta subunit
MVLIKKKAHAERHMQQQLALKQWQLYVYTRARPAGLRVLTKDEFMIWNGTKVCISWFKPLGTLNFSDIHSFSTLHDPYKAFDESEGPYTHVYATMRNIRNRYNGEKRAGYMIYMCQK